MVDIDRVVGGLVQLVQDAHVASALCGCSEDSQSELVLVDCLRTTESEDDTAFLYLGEGDGVQSRIAFQCIAQGIAMFGKSRWVQHDEVVVAACFFQEFEGIFGESLMSVVIGEIELRIGTGQFDGLFAAIHRVYQRGTAPQRVDRETACIAEHIEYSASAGILLQQAAVFALVNEKACFLPVQPVYVEAQSVFGSDVVRVSAAEKTVFLLQVRLEG